tara:strand:- start:541 stop:747 length:207 start_codon:yes stop_codon:yes gene_type:complete
MATIRRTVSDCNGKFLYSVLQTHASQASAAGSFQARMKESLIISRDSCPKATVVKCDNGDVYRFEEVV